VKSQRWLRIIPVALIMYTISYVDRTNVALALDPRISSMMKDLLMDDRLKGQAAGIFFFGYVLLQIPGGYFASRWSPKKLISLFLVFWGICAVGCGLVSSFREFAVMRFLLGVAESGVFPTMLVLLANWFPRSERARANAYWNLCQPLAVAASAPVSGWLLGAWGWQTMLMAEGALPFLWLPVWLYFISDHPRDAKWISREEKDFLEATLQREAGELEPAKKISLGRACLQPAVFVMLAVCFLYNFASYGCNTFLTEGLRGGGHNFTGLQTGLLFAVPYAVTAVVMVLLSRHSDRTGERRISHRERFAQGTFLLALVCVPVPGHSGAVCGTGPVLCHSHGNHAARDRRRGHGPGECARKCRRLSRPGHRRRIKIPDARHRHSVRGFGRRAAPGGGTLLSAAKI
jgi:MFS family permease